MAKQAFSLVVNSGSSSVKCSLFKAEEKILFALFQKEGERKFSLKLNDKKAAKITKRQFDNSLKHLSQTKVFKKLLKKNEVEIIGFRMVQGAHHFSQPTEVSNAVLKKLKELDELAPLHNPLARKLIVQSRLIFPKAKKVMVFDTGFHHSIPEINWRYALPRKISDKHHLRRYGFHGTVCSSIVSQLKQQKKLRDNLIICHLGSGCSVTAVKKGKSVDTSMGFTPLEGLIMGTRIGDIDPGLLLYLQKKLKLSNAKLADLLNHESGLKGLAETSDMRELLQAAKKGNQITLLALEMFCQRAAKVISSCVVSLGGIDQLIFSGGIGENTPEIRRRICEYLKPLRVRLSIARNKSVGAGEEMKKGFSRVSISWMKPEEDIEIRRQLATWSID